MIIGNKITDRFLHVVGLFQNVLWKYADQVAYNQDKEQIKKVLHEVYWYKDIYDLVPPELDKDSTDRFLKTVFTYYEQPLEDKKQ